MYFEMEYKLHDWKICVQSKAHTGTQGNSTTTSTNQLASPKNGWELGNKNLNKVIVII